MRVITRFGFGEAQLSFPARDENIAVHLDKTFRGGETMDLHRIAEVFPFTDYATVRVINTSSPTKKGPFFSNLQFHLSPTEAERLLSIPTPVDETTLVLNLENGTFKANRTFSVLPEGTIALAPWVDRWAPGPPMAFGDVVSGVEVFDHVRETFTPASDVISSGILLNILEGRVMRFFIAIGPPQGVIFEKKIN